jgi:hypothetical protein
MSKKNRGKTKWPQYGQYQTAIVPYEGGKNGEEKAKKKFVGPAVIPPSIESLAWGKLPTLEEEFSPRVTEEVFWGMAGWLNESPHRDSEQAGLFVYDEHANEIVWAVVDRSPTSASPGGVTTNTAHMVVEALKAGFSKPPNGQWHTHPHMGTFWSDVDRRDQVITAEVCMRGNPSGGEAYFLVIDGLDWLPSSIVWKDGKLVGKREGHVTVSGREFKLDYRRPAYRYPTTYIGYKSNGYGMVADDLAADDLADTYDLGDGGLWVKDEAGEWVQSTLGVVSGVTKTDWVSGLMGMWSNDEEDYRLLFDHFGVEVGEWRLLFNTVTKAGKDYFALVDNPASWSYQGICEYGQVEELLVKYAGGK